MDDAAKYKGMTDHDLLITVATKLEGIESKLAGEGGVCDHLAEHDKQLTDQGGRLATVESYWKVAIGILVVIVPTVIVIAWDILR